ncbi:MAG TPA: hypothetical protein VL362_02155 [Patescibacteria group bacterium]|nr:hypothetical protein [Patescibacteria group bacterium]
MSEFFRTPQNSVSVETDLSTLSLAERARITQRITQKAKASNEEVEVVCSTTADSEAATTVNVSVWTEDAHGTQLAPPLPESLSINWRLVKSVWRATLVTPN